MCVAHSEIVWEPPRKHAKKHEFDVGRYKVSTKTEKNGANCFFAGSVSPSSSHSFYFCDLDKSGPENKYTAQEVEEILSKNAFINNVLTINISYLERPRISRASKLLAFYIIHRHFDQRPLVNWIFYHRNITSISECTGLVLNSLTLAVHFGYQPDAVKI